MSRRLLVFASLLLLFVPTGARSTVGPPVGFTLVHEPAAARAGEAYRGVLRVRAGQPLRLADLDLAGAGWTVRFERAIADLELGAGDSVDLPFVGTPSDPSAPLRVTARMGERTVGKAFDLSPRAHRERVEVSAMTENPLGRAIPHPGVVPDPDLRPAPAPERAAKDRTPSLATIVDESGDTALERDTGELGKRRSITIEGRFVYARDDGQTLGVDNATVRVFDEDSTYDTKLAEGLTDANGYYSFTFDWDPCALCDKRPDIYVEFELANSEVVVESAAFEVNYRFASGTLGDFEGSYHDFGWLGPSDESLQAGPHIFNHVLRSWRWVVNNTPYDPPSVDVQWPDGDTGAFYRPFFEEIHMSSGREWNESTCAHEYGHHFIHNFAQSQTPDYCNGICDSPTDWYEFWDDGCGHCIWCEETDNDAWNEGWPNWLADVVTRDHLSTYGYAVMNVRDMEDPLQCDGSYDPPRITEGFLAALLRDIEDAGNEDQSDFDGEDKLSWGADEIFTVTVQDDPLTPVDFLANFISRYGTTPAIREAIWFTAANNGYETDNAKPGVVSNLTSSSHDVNVASPDNTIRLTWTTATDDQSGIQGYGIFVSANTASSPSAVLDIDDVTQFTTEQLVPGTYYFNIRAVDNSGKWSDDYASAGPYVVREPEPANLVFDTNSGWGAFVVPRTTADSGPTFVPAPTTLPGNVKETYWNSRTENVGETSVACCPRVNVRIDGLNAYSSPFDPSDVYDIIAGLGPSTSDNSLNQGPIYVKGGRHTFGAHIDSIEEVAETSETDNFTAQQWIWTPLDLITGAIVERNHPPDRDGGWDEATGSKWYNVDGLRFDGDGWWNVVWAHPTNLDRDIDLRLHQPSSGATDGFDTNVGWSSRGAGRLDAVLVNRNVTGAQDWDVGVLQATDDYVSGLYRAEHVESIAYSFGDSTDKQLPSGDMLQVYEVYVPTSGVGPVSVTVELDRALGPDDYPAFRAAWFGRTFGTGDLADAEALAITSAPDGRLRLTVDVPEAGYHGLVVYRDPADGQATWDYTIEVDRSPPDWFPLKPTNWYAPVVPHLVDADLVNLDAPTTLPGNADATYVSLNVRNGGGTGADGTFRIFTRIDGVDVTGSVWSSWPAQFTRTVLGRGPVNVDGGRHTLTLVADPLDEYEEVSEENNVFGEQWVWTPLPLALGVPVTRDQPSARTVGWDEISTTEAKWFNADGLRSPVFEASASGGTWGMVAAMPADGSDVDIRWHEASTGAKDGFSTNLAYSGWGPQQSDLLLVNFGQTAYRAFDVGVLDQGGAGYTAEAVSSVDIGSPVALAGGPHTIPAGHVAQLFEVELQAGIHVMELQNLTGDANLGFSLHGPETVFASKSDALAASWFEGPGEGEWITVDVPVAGTHALVVWKTTTADLELDSEFALRIDAGITDAPPGPGAITASRIHGVKPNPFNPRTTVAFDLRERGTVSLVVHNVRGERVRTLVGSTSMEAGRHEVVWNGTDDDGRQVASGTYFVSLRTPSGSDQRKLTLVK